MPTTVLPVGDTTTAHEPPFARRELRQTLNDALSLAAKAVKMDGEGDFVRSMEAYEQSISYLDKSIALMREHGALRSNTGRDAEQEVAQLQKIRDKYSARIQAHRQEMGQFVQLASTLPASSPLSDYASTLPRPKTPRTPQTPPVPPPTGPLPPLPLPDNQLEHVRGAPQSAPYWITVAPDTTLSSPAGSGLPSPESPYDVRRQHTVPHFSKPLLRTHVSTPHLRMPPNVPPPSGALPTRPTLQSIGINLPPPPSHPPPTPHSPPSMPPPNGYLVNRVPLPVDQTPPIQRSKSAKSYRTQPSLTRPSTATGVVHPYSNSTSDDSLTSPNRNIKRQPSDVQKPLPLVTSSSTNSFESTGTSDGSSGPAATLSASKPESPPAKSTTFKKTAVLNDAASLAYSMHAQVAGLPIMLMPKLKKSGRPRTAPLEGRGQPPYNNNLSPINAPNSNMGTVFIPSQPSPLSPITPSSARGPSAPGLLSLPSNSPIVTPSNPSVSSPPVPAVRFITAVPQLPPQVPTFLATYSTVPSQKIPAPKPVLGSKIPPRPAFQTLRLVQGTFGTPSNVLPTQGQKFIGGGYVSENLYVPSSVWHIPESWIFIGHLGDKVKALETLQESLRTVQDAAVALFGPVSQRPHQMQQELQRKASLSGRRKASSRADGTTRGAQEWITALDGLLTTLSALEVGMGKKLGLGEVHSSSGTTSRTQRMRNWSTRVARKSFGVGGGKASGGLGEEYVDALGAVCAGVRMLDIHASAIAPLTQPHLLPPETKETELVKEEDKIVVETLMSEYQELLPQQVIATRIVLEKIASAFGTVVVPFILRDLGALLECSLVSHGEAEWMGATL